MSKSGSEGSWATLLDGFVSTAGSYDWVDNGCCRGGEVKLDGFAANAAKVDWPAWTCEKIDRALGGSWQRPIETWAPPYDDLDQTFTTLSKTQAGWLSKGLRDWSSYIAKATQWLLVETDGMSRLGLFDLKTFLYRRQLRGMERGTRWARWSKRTIRAWLRRLGSALLVRLAERLRSERRPKVLLALLKAPPGWVATRFYLDFQATLPRLLERLSEVQAPNAPSLPPGHPVVLGGNVA
jgi:hypothetical protein